MTRSELEAALEDKQACAPCRMKLTAALLEIAQNDD